MNLYDNAQFNIIENLDLLAKQVVEGFIIGLHKSPFHGFSVEFAEHRLYNKGDSTKNIDWKIFARTDKLFTKRYEEETNLRCQIVIDASSSMYFPSMADPEVKINKFGFSALAGAALMRLLQKQRDAFGLTIFGDKIDTQTKAKSSTVHYNLLLSYLKKYSEERKQTSSNIAQVLHEVADSIHKRSLVIVFSDMFDSAANVDEIFNALQHIKHNKHEVILFDVMDKKLEMLMELEDRPYILQDMETGEEVKIQAEQVREHYAKQFKEHQENIKVRCLQHKIDLIEADIREGFNSVLQSYLVKRSSMRI